MKKNNIAKTTSLMSAAIIVIVAVIYNNKNNLKNSTDKTEQAGVTSEENPLQIYKVNSKRDTILRLPSGSEIKIEKETFVDAGGNKIIGEVNLSYREFRAVSETILAEIPMQFDTVGKEQHFQSAGMFEINAHFNGEPVFIHSSKTMEVKLASLDTSRGKFNQYYLADRQEKWHYVKKDSLLKIKMFMPDSGKPSENNLMVKALKPVKAGKESQQFLIDIPKGSFPELEVFKNVLFEVSPKSKIIDKSMMQVDWSSVDIEKMENTTDYKISFHASAKDYTLQAYPVFDTVNYSAALKKYNQLIADYEIKIGGRQKAIEQKNKQKESQFGAYVEAMAKFRVLSAKYSQIYNDSLEAITNQQKEFQLTTEAVYRTFQINKFGIWNSDCPQNLPQGATLFCNFKTEEGKTIVAKTIFLVEKGRNAVFTYYPNGKISLNPEMDNVLILLTADNTLAWVSGDILGNLNASTSKQTFTVKHVSTANTLSHLNQIIS